MAEPRLSIALGLTNIVKICFALTVLYYFVKGDAEKLEYEIQHYLIRSSGINTVALNKHMFFLASAQLVVGFSQLVYSLFLDVEDIAKHTWRVIGGSVVFILFGYFLISPKGYCDFSGAVMFLIVDFIQLLVLRTDI